MLKKLLHPTVQDICPNCGKACAITDVLCPNCGKNLDDLFEQLPAFQEPYDLVKMASTKLPFLNWLTPLLLLLSPLIVSLITALHIALYMARIRDQIPYEMIWHAVLESTVVSSSFLLISVILLFLCTTTFMRAKIGQRPARILITSFSILSVIALWLGLSTANIMAAEPFRIGFYIPRAADWVYFVIAGDIVLIILNLMVTIRQGQAA
jgi:hypothetical protein